VQKRAWLFALAGMGLSGLHPVELLQLSHRAMDQILTIRIFVFSRALLSSIQ